MYTLRQITKENNCESNTFLGNYYEFISKERSPELFKEVLRVHGFIKDDGVHGIIKDSNGNAYSLYEDSNAFIMTEGGKTFARLN